MQCSESRISKLPTKQTVEVVTEMLPTISHFINWKSWIQAEENLPQIILTNNINWNTFEENTQSSSEFGKIKEKTT